MPHFDTQAPPERRKRPLKLRIVLLANRLRRLLIASKPRIQLIDNRLHSLLITTRFRTLLIGGVLLLFVMTASIGPFIPASIKDTGALGPGYYDLDYDYVSCDSFNLSKTGYCDAPMGDDIVYCKAKDRSLVDESTECW
jgi:hypothetical protein